MDEDIEIAAEDLDGAPGFVARLVWRGLRAPQLLQASDLLAVRIDQIEVSKPPRLALEHELCRPRLGTILPLRTGEAVDIGSVLRDQDEIVEIAFDQTRLVLSPNRRRTQFGERLGRSGRRYLEEVDLSALQVGVTRGETVALTVRDRSPAKDADRQAGTQLGRPLLSPPGAPTCGFQTDALLLRIC